MRNLYKLCMVFALATAMLVSSGMLTKDAQASFKFNKEVNGHDVTLKLFGFSQLEARAGKGEAARNDESDDGLRFTAQRIRLGYKFFVDDNIGGKLHLDFKKTDQKSGAGLPEIVKDAFVSYKYNKALFARLGMIKTPNGLGYTTPGWNLDIVERNKLDKGLVLERDMGITVSGRYLGFGEGSVSGLEMGHEHVSKGIGYDVGVYNPAGRSASVVREGAIEDDKNLGKDHLRSGDSLTYVGRLHYDWYELLHFETSYGVSEEAGGRDTEDYKVFDIGATSQMGPCNLKAEFIQGTNIKGVEDQDMQTYTLTAAYHVTQQLEGVVKHYQAKADTPSDDDHSLGNTYLGVNVFLAPLRDDISRSSKRKLQQHRLQFNYVFVSGDDDVWDQKTEGWGKTDDAVLAQYQYKF